MRAEKLHFDFFFVSCTFWEVQNKINFDRWTYTIVTSQMRGEKNKWVLTWNSRRQLSGRAVGHVHNGRGSLVHHHLILVPQAALNEVKQGAVVTIQKKEKEKKLTSSSSQVPLRCVTVRGKLIRNTSHPPSVSSSSLLAILMSMQ